jgi:hypothetical protein
MNEEAINTIEVDGDVIRVFDEFRHLKGTLRREHRIYDYAKQCFELSRGEDRIEGHVYHNCRIVENRWLSDVAQYIVELENEIKSLKDRLEDKLPF